MTLYKILKKTDTFVRTEEAQHAMENLKATLTLAPVLVTPEREEPLLLYITANNHIVSAALVVEREEPGRPLKDQQLVYVKETTF